MQEASLAILGCLGNGHSCNAFFTFIITLGSMEGVGNPAQAWQCRITSQVTLKLPSS